MAKLMFFGILILLISYFIQRFLTLMGASWEVLLGLQNHFFFEILVAFKPKVHFRSYGVQYRPSDLRILELWCLLSEFCLFDSLFQFLEFHPKGRFLGGTLRLTLRHKVPETYHLKSLTNFVFLPVFCSF